MKRYDRLRYIQTLNPEDDYPEIQRLITRYEFPWDYRVGFELALMTDIVLPSVSRLLASTGRFTQHGQKRFDDTMLFEYEAKKSGLDSANGRAAVRAMNHIHRHYRISNDDFRYLLASQTLGPIDWIDTYGWRRLAEEEERALILTGRRMGELMGIKDIPPDTAGFREVLETTRRERATFDPANREIADAVFALFADWAPPPLRPLCRALLPRTVAALLEPPLPDLIGLTVPGRRHRKLIRTVTRERGKLLRLLPPRPDEHPYVPRPRTYPHGWTVADLGPLDPAPAGPSRCR
ncbi:oxygenase MpaB family protein [Amycolatopsis sp. NPDC089917]|uniref:oxygenase MpaB family protein n=1 Tax=Amycolatopsis sp. NPDC089917 TaxID=3155187 RepID=UPI00341EB610